MNVRRLLLIAAAIFLMPGMVRINPDNLLSDHRVVKAQSIGPNAPSAPITIYEENFEGDTSIWTRTGLWDFPVNSTCLNPSLGYSSPVTAAAYNQGGADCDYDVDGGNEVDTPTTGLLQLNSSFNLPASLEVAQLAFKSYEDTECLLGICEFDIRSVEVRQDGSTWTSVWTSIDGSLEGVWYDRRVDLSAYIGRSISLRFRFTSSDGYNDLGHKGWYIDDVRVLGFGVQIAPHPIEVTAPGCSSCNVSVHFNSDQGLGTGLQLAGAYGFYQPLVSTGSITQGAENTTPIFLSGTFRLEVRTWEINQANNIDLFLYKDDGDSNFDAGDSLMARSMSSNSAELIRYAHPANGQYFLQIKATQVNGAPGQYGVEIRDIHGNGQISVSGLPSVVLAGQEYNFNVHFAPPPLGNWEGLIVFGPQEAPEVFEVPVITHSPAQLTLTLPTLGQPSATIPVKLDIVAETNMGGTASLVNQLPAGLEYAGGVSTDNGLAWYDSALRTIGWSLNAWDQPTSSSNSVTYPSQKFDGDHRKYDTYLADDFSNFSPLRLEKIYIPGTLSGGATSLADASQLTWMIFADAGGKPAGVPGVNTPYKVLTPGDGQVILSNGPGGHLSNVELIIDTPILLPAGRWWLVFYPTMNWATGHYGRQVADALRNGAAQVMEPGDGSGGGFGFPTTWTALGDQPSLAFQVEGAPAGTLPDKASVTYNARVTATTGSLVTVGANLDYHGYLYQTSEQMNVGLFKTYIPTVRR